MPHHLCLDEFMPWNEATPKNSRNMRPTEGCVATLQSIADLPDSGRHACMVFQFFRVSFNANKNSSNVVDRRTVWLATRPCLGNKKFIECPLVLKDSHNHRDVTCSLGVDITGYLATKPGVPRRSEQAMDFANAELWRKDSIPESVDAFVDGEGAYDGEDYLVFFTSEALNALNEIEVQADTSEQEEDILDVAEDGDAPREVFVADIVSSIPDIASIVDEDLPFENRTSPGSRFRGHLASYAGASMTCQHLHLRSICTIHQMGPLFRRRQCSLRRRGSLCHTIRLSYSILPTHRRANIDSNVKPATPAEVQRTQVALKPFPPVYWTGPSVQ